MEKHKSKFSLKCRDFHILNKKIEDVVTKITSIWRSIYGLSTPTIKEKGEKELENPKKVEKVITKIIQEVLVKDGSVGGIEEATLEEATTKEEKKDEHNVQDVQVPNDSPPHVDQVSQQDSIQIKDVLCNYAYNINPLTTDYFKKILKDSTMAA